MSRAGSQVPKESRALVDLGVQVDHALVVVHAPHGLGNDGAAVNHSQLAAAPRVFILRASVTPPQRTTNKYKKEKKE